MAELTRMDLAVHQAKVQAHRLRRWMIDRGQPIEAAAQGRLLRDRPLLAEDRSPLWNRAILAADPREWPLERGKVENLRVAAQALHGLEFADGQPFSFWAQLGAPLRLRGYVEGRELREGCVVPGVGGGLCLLSNGLFAAAERAGMRVLERHAHSRRPPGSRAALGSDATVAWNYVDLRFVADHAWRLEVELDSDWLWVRVRGDRRRGARTGRGQLAVVGEGRSRAPSSPDPAGWVGEQAPSCLSCDQPCGEAQGPQLRAPREGRRSWLVDAVWPEYADYLRAQGRREDRLIMALDGELLARERYAWPRASVGARVQLPVRTLIRSLRSRGLANQGAARQRALLAEDAALARAMAAHLTPEDTELIVAQSLLPHLWRSGALGGRRVTVLMQRLPLLELQARLDEAYAANPQSPTLGDFRGDRALLEDEARALDEAACVLTPHAEVAARFPAKVLHLDWSSPAGYRAPAPAPARARRGGPLRLWMPTSTVGRKGAWELRAALSALAVAREGGVQLWVSGAELEGPGFWDRAGVEIRRPGPGGPERSAVDAVVCPAWVEHQPRALLRAAAAGLPVIASRACGLAGVAGVREIDTGRVEALRLALDELCATLDAGTGPSRAGIWVDERPSGIGWT